MVTPIVYQKKKNTTTFRCVWACAYEAESKNYLPDEQEQKREEVSIFTVRPWCTFLNTWIENFESREKREAQKIYGLVFLISKLFSIYDLHISPFHVALAAASDAAAVFPHRRVVLFESYLFNPGIVFWQAGYSHWVILLFLYYLHLLILFRGDYTSDGHKHHSVVSSTSITSNKNAVISPLEQ